MPRPLVLRSKKFSEKSFLSLYDTKTGDRLLGQPFPDPEKAVWSPSGRQVAVYSQNSQQVHILNSQLQDQLTIECPHKLHDVQFSPNGDLLATIDQDEIILYLAENGELVRKHPLPDTGRILSFSRDGIWLAYCGNGELIGLWNLIEAGKSVEFPGGTQAHCLAISADNKMLASGHSDGIVRIWQLEGAKLLKELVGHSRAVNGLFFSQNGRALLSSSADKTSRVWSMAQQHCIGTLNLSVLAKSPSGRHVVVGYPSGARDPEFPTPFILSID